MPKQRTVQNSEIRPNQYVTVVGRVTWSRIASFIEGDELDQKNKRRATINLSPINAPHTSFAIDQAQIRPVSKNNNVLTNEEIYIKEGFFQSSNQNPNPNARSYEGWRYSIDNRGNKLPAVYRRGDTSKGEKNNDFYKVYPKYEIARGSKVMLLLRSYAGRMGNNSFSLDAVFILDTEAKYATPNSGSDGRIADYMKNQFNINLHNDTAQDDTDVEYTGQDAVNAAARTMQNTGIAAHDTAQQAPAAPVTGGYDVYGAPSMPIDDIDDDSVTVGITVDDFVD